MSYISSTSINTTSSPEELRKKAEKRVLMVKKTLKLKLNEEALKTLKLEDLIMQIDQQIEERRIVDRKLRQLPPEETMTWDGNVESYVDFRRQMKDMLIYDSESLRLSTLKAQISGKDKNSIPDQLYNVDSIEEAFSVLDTHFGDIRTVLPGLRAKLDKLPSHPEREDDEN